MNVLRDVRAPSATELRAAGLTALAEAGLVYLPIHLVLTDAAGIEVGVMAGAVPFVAVYVVGVLLTCRFRASRNATTAAAVVAVLIGVTLGRAVPERTVVSVLIGLLVALRAVTLALRDWREPIHAEIGVGASVLGIEALLATAAIESWRAPLLLFVPLFFLSALASRATGVWAPEVVDAPATRAIWIRRAAGTAIALGAITAGAAVLAVRGGVLDRIGRWLTPVGEILVSLLATGMMLIARPILWLLGRAGLDPEALRELLEEFQRRAEANRAREQIARPESTWWQRLMGLLVLVWLAWLLYRAVRRLRPEVGSVESGGRATDVNRAVPLPDEEERLPRRSSLRREPPTDTVRRWYAEVLEALRQAGIPKEPALTPGEFVPEVVKTFPDIEQGLRRLTRLYEDVRYGNRHLSGDVVRSVEPEIRTVLTRIRHPA